MMKKLLVALGLILACAGPAHADLQKFLPMTLQNAAGAAGNGAELPVDQYGGVGLDVTITATATVTFEAKVSGGTYGAAACASVADTAGTLTSTTTASGSYQCNVAGMSLFRARISSFGSGTVTVLANSTTAVVGKKGGGAGGAGLANVSDFPSNPATGAVVIVTDDSSVGACDSAAGVATTICRWDGVAWMKLGDGTASGGSLSSGDIDTSSEIAAIVTNETGTGLLVFGTSPTFITPLLGTPTSGTLTNTTGFPTANLAGAGTGVLTFLATPTTANLAAAVTGETGTGAVVFATSPTLVTPALGTPASGVLTNATGYTIPNLSGAGTGVLTFLATPTSANLATALTNETGTGAAVFGTSPTLVTPVLGTPASGTLTNTTGFPTANLAGAGTGVLTFLATPTSANLLAALTNETGTGAAVFATSPTFVTPLLGTPTSGVMTNVTGTAAGLTAGLASALAANGTNCIAGSYPLGIDASGAAEGCTVATGSSTGGSTAVQGSDGAGGFTDTGCTGTGALLTCSGGYQAGTSGIGKLALLEGAAPGAPTDAGSHNLYFNSTTSLLSSHENGGSAVTYYSTANIPTNVATATALAADGANCSAGSYPLGVDASGAVQGCTVAGGGGGSGTVTNTGGNLTANAVVLGAGTVDSKVVAGIITDGTSKMTLGVAGASVGSVDFKNATSGTITMAPVTGALGTVTLSLPAATDTLVGKATTDTLTNKTLTSPTLTTPALGTPASGVLTNATGYLVSALTGAGTGVLTALATNQNAAGGYSPIDGSATLTNKTVSYSTNTVTIQQSKYYPAAGCISTTAGSIWNLPVTNAAVPACITGTNTQKGVLDFNDTTDQSAELEYLLPTTWVSPINARLVWLAAATTGSVGWCIQLIAVADAETDDPAYPAQASGNCVSDAAKGTTLQTNTASINSVTISGVAAGELLHIRVSRDANGGAVTDDMTGDARLIGVELTTAETQ